MVHLAVGNVHELRPGEFAGRWWWGTAASAVQAEGASLADDWYRWERAGRAPSSGNGNGFGTRFAEDFALFRELGMTDHRLSINWARVVPDEGVIDRTAVDYYRGVLAAGVAAGLRIWVCLLHSAIPAWFADRGGFAGADAMDLWLEWVELVATLFGDLVGGWIPFNTPSSYALKGYLTGVFPPGHGDVGEAISVLATVYRCEFEAALRLRANGKLVYSNEALLPLYPVGDGAAEAAARLDLLVWDSWLALARQPRYAGAFDLFGFTYYYGSVVTGRGELLPYPTDQEPGPLGHVRWADGIVPVLRRLHRELPGARFVVAEVGYGGDPQADDLGRCEYLVQVLRHVAAAQDEGMRIEGVSLWTGVDNYEWLSGFDVPFGLITRERTPRRSASLVQAAILGGPVASAAREAPLR
ncbi:MAG TPA: family 1 glycosylhydrolase [Pseudonocardiaceae bacterium]|nr:family 1 glycosylhydrolase [Pseudonocardiaceae bacterium]